jgi:hypothetical protein
MTGQRFSTTERSVTMTKNRNVEKGPGLARGPALIAGSILLAFALLALITHNAFPSFGSNFPDGNATGSKFLLFEVNGWTNWLLAACGGLLLFGSAQHLLAKTMSLIVGLTLGAAAVIALVSGDILGLGAANFWTWLGLAIAAAVLLLNLLAPRVKHDRDDDRGRDRHDDERFTRAPASRGDGDRDERTTSGTPAHTGVSNR